MSNLELNWKHEDGKISIIAKDVKSIITIDDNTKQIDGVRKFFQEVIFLYFIDEVYDEITLKDDDTCEIVEVKEMINEIIVEVNKHLASSHEVSN